MKPFMSLPFCFDNIHEEEEGGGKEEVRKKRGRGKEKKAMKLVLGCTKLLPKFHFIINFIKISFYHENFVFLSSLNQKNIYIKYPNPFGLGLRSRFNCNK
ncbi:hypothetical protein BpHYR1_027117 [Brachionus plicatilis]|uniref:Uncharacterized protein n=1 Tax=Brachionus plicatilis TaxID=10195 RepID=A0A3M7QWH1_BRAPC|nr:hypothetical protein BpHYR1_027117 [Brachionus plicatilis]